MALPREADGSPGPECPSGPWSAAPDFAYGREDLVVEGVRWRRGASGELEPPAPSRFDQALGAAWGRRMEEGLFRYRLGELPTRVLPGPLGLVAQLNVERGERRRRPQDVRSVRQAFDPGQFNFNEIRPGEVLFRLSREPGREPGGGARVLVVINVSPLERGHVLFVPEPALGLPQLLLEEPLLLAAEAVLLSTHPGFRVGFNSLGGFASVNHLHLHGYYLARPLPVETAASEPLDPRGRMHLLRGGPAPGFLFFAEGPDLGPAVRGVCRVAAHLAEGEIAHNLFVTRGAPPGDPPAPGAPAGLRFVLWPRRAGFGVKEGAAFNVALCELAGHLPLKTARDFRDLTEAAAMSLIRSCLLPPDRFARLQRDLLALLD
ncbi:GDP-D-glucose phosphorylase 1 [Ornithorhynchus anatinus]|uniref:GDP-D-glucose phosphorylase 1 n=1 Tax=Ornithorhynchus anatinus TaxID=9258 RepID=A0A6I8PMA2_ORNAN|nr:GDP-D-glucose phosphorylase 1 [Ornithorhynchus anatinus]XP_028905688.1 GDP-D-glucose phosphorylase 1 [Ornithorhynchus anatinus]XP_028905689.1 GDP-D-glucose phosphorylase 1 [Ornithorhynchus anatinus]